MRAVTVRSSLWLAALLTVPTVLFAGCQVPTAAPQQAPQSSEQATPLTRDVFAEGVAVELDDDPEVWTAWSLLDRDTDRRIGSTNRGSERTNAESTIKAWIALDYLRVADEAGRARTAAQLDLVDRAIRASDDNAAERMYKELGRDDILADLDRLCGVTVTTSQRFFWSYTQVSADDATAVLDCVLELAPRYEDGDRLLAALHGVDPDGAFGIPEVLAPDIPVAVKNGWTEHSGPAQWNVNCVAAWDRYALAVLVRYPIDRGRGFGEGVCRDVARPVVDALGDGAEGPDPGGPDLSGRGTPTAPR